MKRMLVLAVVAVSTLGGATRAWAQVTATSSLPDGSTLSYSYLYLHEKNNPDLAQPIQLPNSLWNYFNYAHCECARPNVTHKQPYYEDTFAYLVQLSAETTPQHVPMQVWVGANCNDLTTPTTRMTNCHQITADALTDVSTILATNGVKSVVGVYDLMMPEAAYFAGNDQCQARPLAANMWVAVDTDLDGTYDYWVNQEIDTDSQPPPTPTSFQVAGSEGGASITWKAPIGNVADIAYYQALCVDANGNPPASSSNSAKYATPRTLCAADEDLAIAPVPCTFDDSDDTSSCTAPATTTTTTVDAGIDASDDLVAHREAPAGMDAAIDAPPDAAPDAGAGLDAGSTVDAAPAINLAPLMQLDPKYICGETDNATATGITVGGLTNNVDYTILLLAIDKYGNAAGVYFNKPITPKPVTDFWQDLHEKGSRVEGGLCLLSATYGDDNPLTGALRRFRDHTLADTFYGRWLTKVYYATLGKLGGVVAAHWPLRILAGIVLLPLVLFALLWHVLTLPGLVAVGLLLAFRRRVIRSRMAQRALAAGALGFVLFAAPHDANAQSPYWENQAGEDQTGSFLEDPGEVKWMVGAKVGPYTPAIDTQNTFRNSAGQGPYKAMFGGYAIMPVIDVDRFLWSGFGQFGVGLSLGYMGKSAHAYVIPSDPSDPDRPRSPGDTTAFRLIPLQLTAIYRFSYLDDEWGIPVVPYVRGGLAYYIWWSTIDGHLSEDPNDVTNKSYGASAGLVGTVGLAVRAERIDTAAARAMRESGIYHAGFYGEINAGWVDGFGKDTKLDVGDTTWFAGVNFEF